MGSGPVSVVDIGGVVSVPATPWMANLQPDWGIGPAEMLSEFFRKGWHQVVQGRLDLYVALHNYLEPKGLADRLQEFVAYWFEKDGAIDRTLLGEADAWRRRTGGRCFAATNQEHHRAAWLREQAGLRPHLRGNIPSAAVGVCKPPRGFFTTAPAPPGGTPATSHPCVAHSGAQ